MSIGSLIFSILINIIYYMGDLRQTGSDELHSGFQFQLSDQIVSS